MVEDRHVQALEQALDELNAELKPLEDFILPGGTRAAALCHQARAVCRRAERRVYTLSKESEINGVTNRFLNRLSDLLFVMARYLNKQAGVKDVLWEHEKK